MIVNLWRTTNCVVDMWIFIYVCFVCIYLCVFLLFVSILFLLTVEYFFDLLRHVNSIPARQFDLHVRRKWTEIYAETEASGRFCGFKKCVF